MYVEIRTYTVGTRKLLDQRNSRKLHRVPLVTPGRAALADPNPRGNELNRWPPEWSHQQQQAAAGDGRERPESSTALAIIDQF
jgi:hypothetical protein